MQQADSAPIWLSTHGMDPMGRNKVKAKEAILRWNTTDQLVTIETVDDTQKVLSTILSIHIQGITKILFSSTDCIIKVNEAFYIMQPRNTDTVTAKSISLFVTSPTIASATSPANIALQRFKDYARSVIPDRVVGGRISIKTRIIAGLILSAVAIIAITIYSWPR